MMLIAGKEIRKILCSNLQKKAELITGQRAGIKCVRCGRRLSKLSSMERHSGDICYRKLLEEQVEKDQLKLFS